MSPIAIEVVRRIDALFESERRINGKSAQERLDVRQMLSRPVVEALRLFGARSVVAVSPFVDERNQDIKRFLEASGFRVPAARGLGLVNNIDFAMQSAEAAYDLARAAASAAREAEAIYIACPRWPTVDIIAALESDTGKLVVSATAAMVWGALRAVSIKECTPGYGKLMESLRASKPL